ncbi:hypothetical protein E1B28_013622 [Marasmius oreades]|uniref:Uncharacterized protein n=1 Tax=Marasmius oreades TaxID=181124 RepID=A0A9P7RQ63_9AGAR|nr:uncharacterized protein E1B28_013622 [Marasmius oreades]KAG7087674.1 hypothetical protein E1B28_013622 [Marasmius oreades]
MRACRRYISSSAPLRAISSPFHSFRVSRFLQLLSDHKETKHSVYPLVEAIHDASAGARTLQHHLNLIQGSRAVKREVRWNQVVLTVNDVSIQELERWKPVLDASNIESATRILHRTGYITQDDSLPISLEGEDEAPPRSPSGSPVPPWILFYLVSHKVRALPHATGPMLSLTLSHLNYTPPELKGSLIILSVFQLAKFNAVLPMQLLTNHFLRLDLAPNHHASNLSAHASKIYFNLLLQAISRNPIHSVQSASSTVALLKGMDSRKLTLWQETCDELLNDRFVVLELTKWLRERAVREGYVPKSGQLVEYVKLFTGSKPAIEDDDDYRKVVKELQGDTAKFFMTKEGREDRFSAIQFLQGMVEASSPTKLKPPAVETAEVTEPSDDSITPMPLPSFFFSPHRDYESLSQRLQSEWKEGFTKTIKDTSHFSAREIVSFFEWGVPSTISPPGNHNQYKPRVRPTLGLYTQLIRGLLVRGERSSDNPLTGTNGAFLFAEQYFSHLKSTGFTLDSHAIAVGLEAFTRVGKPHKAFALLNECCLMAPLPTATEGQSDVKTLFRKIHLSTIALSDFMTSLMRIGRHDCVCWLFENSVRLYEVYPDSRAVSIFLQAARKAQRDAADSWGSFWSALLRKRKQQPASQEQERHDGMANEERMTEEALRSLHQMVGTAEELVSYQPGNFWCGESSVDRMRKVFWGCAVGQAWMMSRGDGGGGTASSGFGPGSEKQKQKEDVTNSTLNSNSNQHFLSDDKYCDGTPNHQALPTTAGTGTSSPTRTLPVPLPLPSIVSPAQPFIQPADTAFFDSLSVPFPTSSFKQQRLTLKDLLQNTQIDIQALPSYPQVILQDTHFRDYILLLGLAPQGRSLFRRSSTSRNTNEQQSEVSTTKDIPIEEERGREHIPPISELPLVLAWQRYLKISPSRDTLAAAIVLFGEYGSGEGGIQPLAAEIRRWGSPARTRTGGEEEDPLTAGWARGGEFARLVRWIEGWVAETEGSERGQGGVQTQVKKKSLMPDASLFTKWRRIVVRMREGRT